MNHVFHFLVILVGLFGVSAGLQAIAELLRGSLVAPLAGVGGMLVVNATLVVQATSYIVFMIVMDRVLFRPMLAHLDSRRGAVKEAEVAADAAEKAVRGVEEKRQAQIDAALREASKERTQIKAESVAEYQRVIQEARTAADARVEAGRVEIEAEAAAAEKELSGQVSDLAGLIQGKLTQQESRS